MKRYLCNIIHWSWLLIIFYNCGHKAVPDERLIPDHTLLNFFYTIYNQKLLSFQNSKGDEINFSVERLDSVTYNKTGGFMNRIPSKEISFQIVTIPLNAEKKGKIFISKTAKSDSTFLSIQWCNFRYDVEGSLPPAINNAKRIGKIDISDYIELEAQIKSLLKSDSDILKIFFSYKKGIVALQTYNGDLWTLKGL
jgi:hypothetical protein